MKSIETSKLQVSMDSEGYYAIRLKDGDSYINAFYGGQTSGTSNIDIRYGDSDDDPENDLIRSWHDTDLTLKEFSIENGNVIKMVREEIDVVRYTLRLSIVNATNQGGYMKVEMEMKNLKPTPQDLGTFIYWDTKISNNDGSPFQIIENGWRNYDGDFQVSAFFKDTPNATNADAIWMGNWGYESWNANPRMTWTEHSAMIGQTVETGDTAAGAWYDPVTLQSGDSRKISTIVGVGPKNEPPVLINATTDPNINVNPVRPGDEVVISIEAKDNDEIGNKVDIISIVDDDDKYLKVLGSETLLKDTPQTFPHTYIIPEGLEPGEYTLKIYLRDDTGATSTIKEIIFNIGEEEEQESNIPKFSFNPSTYTVTDDVYSGDNTISEDVYGSGKLTITVERTDGIETVASVVYGVDDSSTAMFGIDYIVEPGTLNFAKGEKTKSFDITIINDKPSETPKAIILKLGNALYEGGDARIIGGEAIVNWIVKNVKPVDKEVGDRNTTDKEDIKIKVDKEVTEEVVEEFKTFNDIKGHWAQEMIEILASKKIITGDDNGNYGPDMGVTRAEFATLIARTLGLEIKILDTGFNDIKTSDWFAPYITAARKAGIVKGVSETMFEPNRIVNRQEMTAMIMRTYRSLSDIKISSDDINKVKRFADDEKIGLWAKDDVYSAKYLNLIKGVTEKQFAPIREATKAEAATLIYRLLKNLSKI